LRVSTTGSPQAANGEPSSVWVDFAQELRRGDRKSIDAFEQHGYTGKAAMKDPEVEFIIYEECESAAITPLPGARLVTGFQLMIR
jgi:hypothetical protein